MIKQIKSKSVEFPTETKVNFLGKSIEKRKNNDYLFVDVDWKIFRNYIIRLNKTFLKFILKSLELEVSVLLFMKSIIVNKNLRNWNEHKTFILLHWNILVHHLSIDWKY